MGETSEASEPEHSPERSPHLRSQRRKFPPGRHRPFDEEDKDETGSSRSSEQEDSSSDSDDGEEEEEEEAKRLREAAAKSVDWEDVKRIIEHPSEDERSSSGTVSEGEAEVEEEEKGSESNSLEAEVEHPGEDDQQGASGEESEPESESECEETISASTRLKAEADRQLRDLTLGSSTASPEPGQEPPSSPPAYPPKYEEEPTPTVIQLPASPITQAHITSNLHKQVEERVIYTTRWPNPGLEPEPSVSLSAPDLKSKSEAVSQTTELESLPELRKRTAPTT